LAETGHGVERKMRPTGLTGADNDRAVSRSENGPHWDPLGSCLSHGHVAIERCWWTNNYQGTSSVRGGWQRRKWRFTLPSWSQILSIIC